MAQSFVAKGERMRIRLSLHYDVIPFYSAYNKVNVQQLRALNVYLNYRLKEQEQLF